METEKKKRGRPPKHKAMEFEGMTYEGAINHALDQVVRADLDKCLANKDESQLTDDERKYLKRKREKKSYTLNVRFTESEMQDILPRYHSPHLRRVKHLKRKKIHGKLSEVWAEQTKSSQTLKLVALCHSASCLDSSSIHLTPMTTQLSLPT